MLSTLFSGNTFLGILFGLAISLDVCLSYKKNWAFSRYIIYLLASLVTPNLLKALGVEDLTKDEMQVFRTQFYGAIVITIGFFTITMFIRFLAIRRSLLPKNREDISFIDIFLLGHEKFGDKIKAIRKEEREELREDEGNIIKLNDDYGIEISKYIIYLLSTIREANKEGFIFSLLSEFERIFFGSSDCRFTLRKLDPQLGMMVMTHTSKPERPPGDIPLTVNNLITESYRTGKPVIYSRNKEKHFATVNNSLERFYTDYVSHCIIEDDNKPLYSVCLDVRGQEAERKMRALVDSGIFMIICGALAKKITTFTDNITN